MRYALVALVCLVAVVSAQAEEQWYVLLNGEDRLGYLHTTTQEDGDRITSTQQMKLAVGGRALRLKSRCRAALWKPARVSRSRRGRS